MLNEQIRLTNSDLEHIYLGGVIDGFAIYPGIQPVISKYSYSKWSTIDFEFYCTNPTGSRSYLLGVTLHGSVMYQVSDMYDPFATKGILWESSLLGERDVMKLNDYPPLN